MIKVFLIFATGISMGFITGLILTEALIQMTWDTWLWVAISFVTTVFVMHESIKALTARS